MKLAEFHNHPRLQSGLVRRRGGGGYAGGVSKKTAAKLAQEFKLRTVSVILDSNYEKSLPKKSDLTTGLRARPAYHFVRGFCGLSDNSRQDACHGDWRRKEQPIRRPTDPTKEKASAQTGRYLLSHAAGDSG